jgi:uncharacterized SAM-binding protein YcdF (DUF218 family)
LAQPRESIHLAALRVVAALIHLRPQYSPWHNLALFSVIVPVYALSLIGLIVARRAPIALLVAAVVSVHFLMIALTHADWDGRSLLVVLPLIGILAGRGLAIFRWSSTWMIRLGTARSDALVLLLGGGSDRPRKAAKLYGRGMGSVILVGGDADLAINRETLIADGVPKEAIQSLGATIGTREEAQRVADYVRAHPRIQRITVVTTAFHTARARWIFKRALRQTGVEVRTAASDDPRFDETNWYTTSDGVRAYIQEILKISFAYLSENVT